MLIAGELVLWSAIGMGVLLITFVIAIASALVRAKDVDCTCFGLLYKEKVSRVTLVRDLVLLTITILVALWDRAPIALGDAFVDVGFPGAYVGFVLLLGFSAISGMLLISTARESMRQRHFARSLRS